MLQLSQSTLLTLNEKSIRYYNWPLWFILLHSLYLSKFPLIPEEETCDIRTSRVDEMGSCVPVCRNLSHRTLTYNYLQLEFLHVNIAIIILLIEAELVIGAAPNNPILRLCAIIYNSELLSWIPRPIFICYDLFPAPFTI
jgi:hypothetical protein